MMHRHDMNKDLPGSKGYTERHGVDNKNLSPLPCEYREQKCLERIYISSFLTYGSARLHPPAHRSAL